MAIYILIQKLSENDTEANYEFGRDADTYGKFTIDKYSGQVTLTEKLPHTDYELVFQRAIRKIQQHWKQGSFPDRTSWAS